MRTTVCRYVRFWTAFWTPTLVKLPRVLHDHSVRAPTRYAAAPPECAPGRRMLVRNASTPLRIRAVHGVDKRLAVVHCLVSWYSTSMSDMSVACGEPFAHTMSLGGHDTRKNTECRHLSLSHSKRKLIFQKLISLISHAKGSSMKICFRSPFGRERCQSPLSLGTLGIPFDTSLSYFHVGSR